MKTRTVYAVLLSLVFGCSLVRAQMVFTPFVTGTIAQQEDGTFTSEPGIRLSLREIEGGGVLESRGFIGFSLPDFGGKAGPSQLDFQIVSFDATLVMPGFGALSRVWDVDSTLEQLTAVSPTAATFADLGSGTFYDDPAGTLILPPDPFNLGSGTALLYSDFPGDFPGYLNTARPDTVFFGFQLTLVPFQFTESDFTTIVLDSPRLRIYAAEPPFQPVPEPTTVGLFAAVGLIVAGVWRSHRRSATVAVP